VAGCYEHGDEPSGSVKCGKFTVLADDRLASQEGLRCMELVIRSAVVELLPADRRRRLIICPSIFESIQFLIGELVPLIYLTLFTVCLIPLLLP
jgi:hypothetical protein